MTSRDEDFAAALTLNEGDDGTWPPSGSAPATETPDWRSLYEEERSRADAAEARAEKLRWAEVDARSRAGSLKTQLDKIREKLKAAVEEVKEVRRTAGETLSLKAEVTRLEKLLAAAGVESSKRSTMMSLRMEVVRLRSALQTVKGQTSKAPVDVPTTRSRADARLTKALQRSQDQNDTIKSLRAEIAELRRDATAHRKTARVAKASLSRKTDQLLKARESSRAQKETIKSLGTQVR